jgi:hypothetical protein
MITFLTLFLGLFAGRHTVELAAEPPVDRVELLLDGEPVGAAGPPFRFEVDFGHELSPHRLTAIGRDADGREVARAARDVNLIPRDAGLEIELEEGPDDRPQAARLRWRSAAGEPPERVALWLDGEALTGGEGEGVPERVPLPRFDPGEIHFLTVEISFPGGAVARSDRVFGGARGREIDTDNTPVALEVEGRRLRRPEQAAGLVLVGGEPVEVLAVEHGPADLVIVRERSAFRELAILAARQHHGHLRGTALGGRSDDRFVLVAPAPLPLGAERSADVLFPASPPFPGARGNLIYWLATQRYDPGRKRQRQNPTRAVAMAGMIAARAARPRAVLLALGPEAGGMTLEETARVRRYLERLRVPLTVWYVQREPSPLSGGQPPGRTRPGSAAAGEPPPSRGELLAVARRAWGESVVDVGSFGALIDAARELRERVALQRIVWIDGDHLPTEVALAPGAPARLAGGGGG